jgi:hypothetical protein
MTEPLQRLVASRTLWLIVAPPLFGFLWHLATGLRRTAADGRSGRATASVRNVGIGAVLLACAATLGHAARLVRAAPGIEGLFQHGAGGTLAGSVDTGLGLLFDPLSGIACTLACAVAAAAALFASNDWRTWAWLELALAGGLLSFLADGFLTTLLGWAIAATAGSWLAGWRDPRVGAERATRGAFAVLAILVGASLLFWGLRGQWDGDDYIVDSPTELAPPRSDARLSFREIAAEVAAPGPLDARSLTEAQTALPAKGATAPEASRRAGPGGFDIVTLALLAFLAAAVAMSATVPPRGAPFALCAVGSATIGALGPFLLLRLAFLAPLARAGRPAIAAAGVFMLAAVARRAAYGRATTRSATTRAANSAATTRGLALAGGAPAGLTCIALSADGAKGGLLVFGVACTVAALLLLTAASRALTGDHERREQRGDHERREQRGDHERREQRGDHERREQRGDENGIEHLLLGSAPEDGGALLVAFEQGVVDALAGAVAVVVRATSWVLARLDGARAP